MSEEITQQPAAGGSQESKKQTVRISLPPKPAASPTIKISVPPAGATEGSKAASTIKIPVPPKTAATGVGIIKPAAPAEKKETPSTVVEEPVGASVEEEAVATAAPKRKKARVKKAAPADNLVDTAVAAVAALGAIGLAAFLASLGGLF